ncbi:MAG: histidine kinase dimerization/phosphoacceptor domain -containing protein [Pseudomonadota bacterium]
MAALLVFAIAGRASAQTGQQNFDFDTLYALLYENPIEASNQAGIFLEEGLADPIDRVDAMTIVGLSHYMQGDFERAVDVLHEAFVIAEETEDPTAIANISLVYGQALAEAGNYPSAIVHMRNAAALGKELENTHIWVAALTNTFGILFESGSYEAALPGAAEAAKIASDNEDQRLVFVTQINVAIVNAMVGNVQTAEDALAAAKASYDIDQSDAYTKMHTAYSEAFVSYHTNKPGTAGLAEACLNMANELEASATTFDCQRILTDLALQEGRPNDARAYLASMGTFIDATPSPPPLREEAYARQMVELARLDGDDKTAATFLQRRFDAARDLNDRQIQIELAVASADFEKEGMELKLSLEAARSEAARAEAGRARAINIAIGGGLILSLLAIYMLIRNLNLSRRIAGQLEKNLDQRDLYARDLRHRSRNNLQTILSLVRMQRRTLANSTTGATALVDELAMRVQAMAVLESQLYEDGGELSEEVQMDSYLRELVSTVAEIAGAKDRIGEIEIAPLAVEPEVAAPIGLIVSELLYNSFKHAVDATVQIALRLSETKKEILMTVADNGPGFNQDDVRKNCPQSSNSGGLGLQIVDDLTRQLGGKIALDQSANGSVWRFAGPLRSTT